MRTISRRRLFTLLALPVLVLGVGRIPDHPPRRGIRVTEDGWILRADDR
jgi:hypothetical protein